MQARVCPKTSTLTIIGDGVEVLVREERAQVLDEVDGRREQRQAQPRGDRPSRGNLAPLRLAQRDTRRANYQFRDLLRENDGALDDGLGGVSLRDYWLDAELKSKKGHEEDGLVGQTAAGRLLGHDRRHTLMWRTLRARISRFRV